jgi:hypothetical protein
MDINEQGQQFSFAYVRAVCAVAGYCVTRTDTDDDSVDLTIAMAGGGGTIRSPKLDVQAKHWRTDEAPSCDFEYRLELKNYDELRPENLQVPRLLVIVRVPRDPADWLTQSDAELSMRHCGHWASLRGLPPTDYKTKVPVTVPRANLFTVDSLNSIMDTIAAGGVP